MPKYATLLSLSIFLLFYSCKSQPAKATAEKETNNVNTNPVSTGMVTLRFTDSSGGRKGIINLFTYPDSFGISTPVIINDSFIRIPVDAPTFITHADAKQTSYLLYPEETVNVTINKNGEYKFWIAGNASRTEELSFFPALTAKFGKLTGVPSLGETDNRKYNDRDSMVAYKKQLVSLKENRLSYLDSVSAKGNLSRRFQEKAHQIITDGSLSGLMYLYWKNKTLLTNKDAYTGYLDSVAIALNNNRYLPNEISSYTSTVLLNLLTSPAFYGSVSSTTDFLKKYDIIKSKFSGMLRDFHLSSLVYSASKMGIKVPDRSLQSYRRDCASPAYLSLTERRLSDLKLMQSFSAKGDILMSIEKNKSLSFDSLIRANKGKIIYIDFWASWCMPCRREMPNSRLLQKEYANKDVLFLYLSIDEQYNDWQKAFNAENMSKADSFLFLNTPSSAFVRKYKIDAAIPRYIIVGRNGEVVNTDAPRPGDPKLRQILNDLLVVRK